MAKKTLQLLRNTTMYESYALARAALVAKFEIEEGQPGYIVDGEPVLARYTETIDGVETQRTILGIKSTGGYEIFGTKEVTDAIKALDFTWPVSGDGAYVAYKPITNITETDGVITPTQGTINAEYVNVVDSSGVFTNSNVETVLKELHDLITANAVSSDDETITITPTQDGGTDISVNIDNSTLVKEASGANKGKISTNLQVYKLTDAEISNLADSDKANIKDAYQLQVTGAEKGTAFGSLIKVYKDSSLAEVYLGDSADTIVNATGVVTKYAYRLIATPATKITAAEYDELTEEQKALYEAIPFESLNFKYQLADGTYSLVKVDVSNFLNESEFGDGLQVISNVVSVLKDSTSGKVRIAACPSGATEKSEQDTGWVDVITVGTNGVKVNNIDEAIAYATSTLAVSAQGDNYITAAVDANNNKKINVTADVQALTATAGTVGVYDAATGAQTTAPVAGTLSGVAESLADSSDIATKIKTYVDGAIAIEAARNDAKNVADIKAKVDSLDGNATASDVAAGTDTTPSTDFTVLTKVNEIDGVIQTVGTGSTDSKSVLLKKVAATGAAADVSFGDTGDYFTATTVEAALTELAMFDCGTY